MHPIERLRLVARAEGVSPSLLVREAAAALAGLGDDPVGTVTACRRLVERHPAIGPMWWLAARVLTAADAGVEAWRVVTELDEDPTSARLAAALPADATTLLLGWPAQAGDGVRMRGDLEVLLVDCAGEARGLAHRLRNLGMETVEVADAGLGAAVLQSDLVVLEASALGPDGFVATRGSYAAAAVGNRAGIPVWVVAGVGRALPAPLWEALGRRLGQDLDEPWERSDEVVPLALADQVVGPHGASPAAD
ncbi:MAG TPA: hypothetical protein VHE80_04660, partial [Acidimicrobiales bacterium]|nr:hypothetical protein [Acidimicrobiales bacterium]